MKWFSTAQALAALSLLPTNVVLPHVNAIDLDVTSPDSIKDASSKIAKEMVAQYATKDDAGVHVLGGYPGILYPPYYWWLAGAMFGTLLDYWRYTGDDQYNDMLREGMIHQFGENLDLMPTNQSKNEGNDDQVFWAYTMMSAAEYNFPAPPDDKPGWLAMVQSVFNQFVTRYTKEVEDGNCKGGMRWQIHPWLNGWTYKNTASNGGLFHLGARLAMYTKNDTYAQWAEKAYDWMNDSPLLEDDGTVNDGMSMTTNPPCKEADRTPWTYNYGSLIAGAAYMYNYTNGADKWRDAINRHLNKTTDQFFPQYYKGIMTEICEAKELCNTDQKSFKAYFSRWLGVCMQMAPFTHDLIMPHIQTSAKAAAQTCVGPSQHGAGNYACGMRWWWNGFDGVQGVGQQMTALNTITVLNVDRVPPPYSSDTGGSSKGDPSLGSGSVDDDIPQLDISPATTGDKAGAAILTILVVAFVVGGAGWMVVE
jgi:predicted alpha-1,6-mannanase (GH76 family)